MFKPQDSVLVGVSGGPDSVALLNVLYTIAPAFFLRLGIAHLNHGLRSPDSDQDAEFAASLAKTFDLPFYVHKADVRSYRIENRLSLEEAARRIRYAFLKDVALKNGFDKIALGHHCDDNAELVLMNLLRGSGPLGISGMPAKRDGKIVRPLINLKRREIMAYLDEKGLKYVCDVSNLDQTFLRNRIRHDLVPRLKASYNPKIVDTLNRLALIVGAEEDWMDAVVQPIFDDVVLAEQKDCIRLCVSGLCQIHVAAQRRVMRKAIERLKGNLRRISFGHIDALIRLVTCGPVYGKLDLPDRIRARRKKDVFLLSREKTALRDLNLENGRYAAFTFEYHIDAPGSFFIKELNTKMIFSKTEKEGLPAFSSAGHQTGFFDMERIRFPLTLRSYRPGDRFTPLGMTGTQKVKKYFINQKVLRPERMRCPVLLSRDKIIWVVGHRIDESVKIRSTTRNVLKVELLLA
ncbi:MAG: tRNA lysidine(34) synthetase TilS [Proteobacteria bacterium]|nr:tRNA lysidine(34) synthetase TilS [Pseudomonadota bacterium]